MGKRKNKGKSKKNANHQQHYKKRKVERYWVEDCVELQPPPTIKPSLVVTISRIELHDDHTHRPESPVDALQGNGSSKTSNVEEEPKPIDDIFVAPKKKHATAKKSDVAAPEEPSAPKKEELKESNEPEASHFDDDISIDDAFICIQRSPSAHGPLKKFKRQNFKSLPNGDCGDGVLNPHKKDKVPDKYWAQRKRFFSRFDDGVKLDSEGWYSITPEKIANHLAQRIVQGTKKKEGIVIMDAFCGCGGNAVAFALRPEVSMVLAIDSDREKLILAANNAAVYGVPAEKLVLIHGNACEALQCFKNGKRIEKEKSLSENASSDDPVDGFQIGGMELLPESIDSVFLSPPWGGMDYEKSGKRNYHIETCIEVDTSSDLKWNGEEILEACAIATKGPVLYFLPRNINGISLGRGALKAKYRTMEIEQNVLNNKLKTVTAYLGM